MLCLITTATAIAHAQVGENLFIERSTTPFYFQSPAAFRIHLLPRPLAPRRSAYRFLGSYEWFAGAGPVPYGRPGGEPLPFSETVDASVVVQAAMVDRLGLSISIARRPAIEGYKGIFLQTDLEVFQAMRPGVPLPPDRPWIFLHGHIAGRETHVLAQAGTVLMITLGATTAEVGSADAVRNVLRGVMPRLAVESMSVVHEDPNVLEEEGRQFVLWGVPEIEFLRGDGTVAQKVARPTIIVGVSLE